MPIPPLRRVVAKPIGPAIALCLGSLAVAGTLVAQSASLEAPAEIGIGRDIEVRWSGPGADYDPIVLVDSGAPDDARPLSRATILNGKNPIVVRAPEFAGDYELRYLSKERVLARRAIRVVEVPASIEAPATVKPGSRLAVSWQGPGNDYDQVVLVPKGAADDARSLAHGTILNGRNPVAVPLPDAAGAYELRYVMTRSKRVLARRDLEIATASASLDAPTKATAATHLEVGWQGPGNDYDQIVVVPRGAPDDAKSLATGVILNGRNPVSVLLPDDAGRYDLLYRTTRSQTVLARRPLDIEPAGRIRVVFERDGAFTREAAASGGAGAVEIILDASGSMLQREGGTRRIEIARTVLDEFVREHLSADSRLALRVFGHKEANACRTDLEIPLGPLDRSAAARRIAAVEAMNLAKTPIADSLAKVRSDLAGAEGPKAVILITDGEETCDGDPEAVIGELRSSGMDVQISIVGFAIDDEELETTFRRWAKLGGGSYFEARSAEELTRSLRTVISGPFRILDGNGREVARGIVGGAEVVLPAGTYRVEVIGTDRSETGVVVRPEQLTTLEL